MVRGLLAGSGGFPVRRFPGEGRSRGGQEGQVLAHEPRSNVLVEDMERRGSTRMPVRAGPPYVWSILSLAWGSVRTGRGDYFYGSGGMEACWPRG